MRLVPVAFALVLLVLAPVAPAATAISAAPGAGSAAAQASSGSGAAANQTVSGTVTYANGSVAGDATVLVGSRAFFEKSSPSDLRDVANGSAQDVAVAETDADGSYSLTAGEGVDAEAIVAVSPTGISRVHPFEAGQRNLTLQTTKALQVETSDARTEPGGRVYVTLRLKNTDDAPVEGLKMTLGKLPKGWNVVGTNSESGEWAAANRTFTWDTVESGEWVEAEVRLFVAIDADTRTHELPVFATSATHNVDAGNASVTVAYPGDTTSQTGVTDGGAGGGADGGDSGVSTPGFGPVVAVVALLGGAALLARRD